MFAASKTASVSGGYQISRSLRFNSADSAYLSRTPANNTNRKTWTLSTWIKRSKISNSSEYSYFATAGTSGSNSTNLLFNLQNNLRFENVISSTTINCVTDAVFRDPSAWYHVVIAVDTTQATNTNGVKIYVNGVQQTLSFTVYTQNSDTYFNSTNQQGIGLGYASDQYFNGLQTEMYLIDGSQLTPSSFGETNAQTGVWQPKAYSGSYGTNGFYLNFSDNSNTTAATLGKDYSGNGNNWTPNNFSVTAGGGNDSLVDSPTSYGTTDTGVGGEIRGNYSTLNPLFNATTVTNGNLDASLSNASVTGTFGSSTGKWYFECTITSLSTTAYLGIADQTLVKSDSSFSYSQVYVYLSSSYKGGNGSSAVYGSTYTTGDVIGVAYDLDAGSITFYKNGTSQGVAFNTGFTSGYIWRPFLYSLGSATFNFGQRPFAYTAPSGYKALCTQNLPTPTIGATTATQAGKYFNPVLYSGNGSSQSVTGVGFQPDFVWVKERSSTSGNVLFDAIRGVTKYLESNVTAAEGTDASTLTAFNSDGFSVGSSGAMNQSSQTYVGWNWKANGSGSTNTSGSITSTVSANTTSGFSVVTYTGTGSLATVGHGLGVAPKMFIVKRRDTTSNWLVYNSTIGATNYLYLNATDASAAWSGFWGNTAPTSTVFTVNNDGAVNSSGNTFVAYCFAEVAGYSKFGSYTGNGSTDGPFVFTGMRPAYLMVKRTDTTSNWVVMDTARDTYNAAGLLLRPNLSDAESDDRPSMDFLSNGFKWRATTAAFNASGGTYIFAAFASAPFKFALAR